MKPIQSLGTSYGKIAIKTRLAINSWEGICSGGVSDKFTGSQNCMKKLKNIVKNSTSESFILHVGGNDAYSRTPGIISPDNILGQVIDFYKQMFELITQQQKELFIIGYLPRYFIGQQKSSSWAKLKSEDRKIKRLVKRWKLDYFQTTGVYAKVAYLDIGFAFDNFELYTPKDEVHLNERGHKKYKEIVSGRIQLNRSSKFKV